MIEKSPPRQPIALRDNIEILSFPAPLHRWVLWHLTGNCNFECAYCYGSFQGQSYKSTFNPKQDIPIEYLLRTADDIADLGFEYVHLCGGEPLLRRDIWLLIERLSSLGTQVFTLTNASFIPARFEENFLRGWLKNLSFSLDALNPKYNDYVRFRTEQVVANIETIANLKARNNVDTELGLYVVLTRLNIELVPELLCWAESIGIGYITVQAVHLPPQHPSLAELGLTEQEHPAVMSLLEQLRGMRSRIRTSSDVLISVTDNLLIDKNLAIKCCFAGRDLIFIDSAGNVYGCPSKPRSVNPPLGNIRESSLRTIVDNARESICAGQKTTCTFPTLDCLGMYELVYMKF